MITEDYVSFETAKLLKEKGFDECTLLSYDKNGNNKDALRPFLESEGDVRRPTIQMAMKWLREKELVICVVPLTFYCGETVRAWGYNIWAGDNLEVDELDSNKFATYEDACEDAMKYALENLI